MAVHIHMFDTHSFGPFVQLSTKKTKEKRDLMVLEADSKTKLLEALLEIEVPANDLYKIVNLAFNMGRQYELKHRATRRRRGLPERVLSPF